MPKRFGMILLGFVFGMILAACSSADPNVVVVDNNTAAGLSDAITKVPVGGTVRISKDTTFNLTQPLVINKNFTLEASQGTKLVFDAGGTGRALEIAAGTVATLKNITISNGKAPTAARLSQATTPGNGGLLYNEGDLTLVDAILENGQATFGGAIYNAKGAKLTLTTSTVGKSTAQGTQQTGACGGGIYNDKDATLNLVSGSITGNTVKNDGLAGNFNFDGGGVCNYGTFSMSGGTLEGNTALVGGGGVISQAGSTFTMTGGAVRNNATNYPASPGSSGGAGIWSNGKMTISGGVIEANTTTGFGGGLVVVGVDLPAGTVALTMTNGSIQGNVAPRGGGGIILINKALMKFSGGNISNNSTERYAGGVNISSDAIFEMSGGIVEGNTSVLDGGGVGAFSAGTFNMTGGVIQGNSSKANGGGIAVGAGNDNRPSTVTVDGGTIQNNVAINNGGGIKNWCSTINLKSGTLKSNTAKAGGGIQLDGCATKTFLNMTGGSIGLNTSSEGGGGINIGGDTVLTIEDGIVESNKGRYGGGINSYDGSINLKGGIIRSNTTTEWCGGGINISGSVSDKGVLSFSGGTIENNTAKDAGAGVCVGKNGKLMMSGGTIQNNIAPDAGGGINLGEGEALISAGTIKSNTAKAGGGINSYKSIITMKGGSIETNKASGNGGGVHNSEGSTFNFENGSIQSNTAENGGGITVYQSTFNLKGGSVSGNTASISGGGIVVGGQVGTQGVLNVSAGLVQSNTATSDGGGIYKWANSVVNNTGGTISNNNPNNIAP